MFSKTTIDFLKNIKKNNNREWMYAHYTEYENAKKDFFNMVEKILMEFKRKNKLYEGVTASQCIFRINRDIRFSKDKSPYKFNFGAAFSPEGKKTKGACYYLHLEPGSSFLGGGMWLPKADELQKIRQEIDYNTEEFFSIIKNKKFKTEFGDLDTEYKLKKNPKGFDENNIVALEYLKLKSFTVSKSITDEECLNKAYWKELLNTFEIITPFIQFINKAIDE